MANRQDWWQRGIVYQIYPRSFMDSNGDGVGDLPGITQRLDYLKDLGVDAIWISPFYKSPMIDFGYDVSDYTDVDPIFGDLSDFDHLVTEVHAREMKLIVDYVPNHTSSQHPWFQESRSSRDNPKRDWYIWRDPKEDGSKPNNWGSMFGGEAWTWDEHTQQYYFHQFDPAQPDLNWRNPEVRAAMLDVLRFWMERGVDGFRMDVVYVIWKHPEMPDQPLREGATGRSATDRFHQQQQIYALNYEGVQDVMREIRATLDEYEAVGIAELWLSPEERVPYYETFHLPFNFDFLGEDVRFRWDAAFFRETVERYESTIPEGGWPNYVLGNHDVQRLASRFGGEDRARVAAMLLLTLRGTPTLYYGDELGMTNGDIKEHQIQDPQGHLLGVLHSRDVARTPMQWSAAPNAGFTAEGVIPWLPVGADYPMRNVATLDEEPQSILSLYQRLIAYRRGHESLAIGDYRTLDGPEGVFVYERAHDDETHYIALNMSDEEQTVELPSGGTIVFNTRLDRSGETGASVTLAADEGILIAAHEA